MQDDGPGDMAYVIAILYVCIPVLGALLLVMAIIGGLHALWEML